ncbi:hypothetical protein P171DRAFT_375323, partial [Karstenula rhodostoma CBS 690.94]
MATRPSDTMDLVPRLQSIDRTSATNGALAIAGNVGGNVYNYAGSSRYVDEETKREVCLDTLFVTDPEIVRSNLVEQKGERVPKTCEWILQNAAYQGWTEKDNGLLWISGEPGQGKTMISIFLTQELESREEKVSAVTFFFCSHQDDDRKSAAAVLRTLLYQILTKRPNLVEHFWPYLKSAHNERNSGRKRHDMVLASEKTLWEMFLLCLKDQRLGSLLFLLDGVDECTDDIFVTKFTGLFAEASLIAPGNKFKMILVSRDNVHLHGQAQIKLDPDQKYLLATDIERFISARVAAVPRLRGLTDSVRKEIKKILKDKSGGTFLWVGFVVYELSRKKTVSEMMDSLETIPPDLDGIYKRILDQIKEEHREESAKLLRLVTYALRSLTLDEVAFALDIQATDQLDAETVVRDKVAHCFQIITINERKLTLVHQSVNDYLLRAYGRDANNDGTMDPFCGSVEDGHLSLAESCL